MKIVKTRYDEEHHTIYFNIEEMSNWDLEILHKLLKAEKARASIVGGFNYAPKELLAELDVLFVNGVLNVATKEENECV